MLREQVRAAGATPKDNNGELAGDHIFRVMNSTGDDLAGILRVRESVIGKPVYTIFWVEILDRRSSNAGHLQLVTTQKA